MEQSTTREVLSKLTSDWVQVEDDKKIPNQFIFEYAKQHILSIIIKEKKIEVSLICDPTRARLPNFKAEGSLDKVVPMLNLIHRHHNFSDSELQKMFSLILDAVFKSSGSHDVKQYEAAIRKEFPQLSLKFQNNRLVISIISNDTSPDSGKELDETGKIHNLKNGFKKGLMKLNPTSVQKKSPDSGKEVDELDKIQNLKKGFKEGLAGLNPNSVTEEKNAESNKKKVQNKPEASVEISALVEGFQKSVLAPIPVVQATSNENNAVSSTAEGIEGLVSGSLTPAPAPN